MKTGKEFGKSIGSSELPDGFARFFPSESDNAGAGLPEALLARLVDRLIARMRKIESAITAAEIRMVGGSALIVYEAEMLALEAALDTYMSDDEDDGYGSDIESEEEMGSAAQDDNLVTLRPYTIKLIDFAHTHLAPGEGPDEGVLLGIRTIIQLLEGRRHKLASVDL